MSAYAADNRTESRTFGLASDYLRGVCTAFAVDSLPVKRILDRTAQLNTLIYEGKHYFFYAPKAETYFAPEEHNQPAALRHVDNYFRFCVRSNIKEYLKSAPVIRARPEEPDSSFEDDAAKIGEALNRDFEARFRGHHARYVEFERVQIGGNCANFLDWDPTAGRNVQLPIYETRTDPGYERLLCGTCGLDGDPAELATTYGAGQTTPGPAMPPAGSSPLPPDPAMGAPAPPPVAGPVAPPAPSVPVEPDADDGMQPPGATAPAPEGLDGANTVGLCPRCQSADVQQTSVPPMPYSALAGTLSVPTGDWVLRAVPIFELWVYAGARDSFACSDVLWLRWHSIQHRSEVRKVYPNARLVGSAESGDLGTSSARFQKQLEQVAGGTEIDQWLGTGVWRDRVPITREWLQPVAYAEYVAPYEHEVIPGDPATTLAAGQRLTDLYPEGLEYIHSAWEPLDCVPRVLADHWQFYGWDRNPESFWSSGVEDAVQPQLDLNEYNALHKSHTLCASMPTTIIRDDYNKGYELATNPSKIVRTGQIGDDMPLAETIYQLHPADLSEGAYRQVDQCKEAIQRATLALNVFNGQDTQHERTATQTSIQQANAAAHAEAIITGIQTSEARLRTLAAKMWKRHASVPRVFEIASDYGEPEQAEFSRANLTTDIRFEVMEGTVLPQRPYQKQDAFERWMTQQIAWLGAFGKEMPPDVEEWATEAYGLPAGRIESDRAGRVAKRNLGLLHDLAGKAETLLPGLLAAKAQQILSQPPPIEQMGAPPEAAELLQAQALSELQMAASDPAAQAALLLEYVKTTPDAPGKVRVLLDNHPDMIRWYETYAKTDKGLDEPPLMQALVEGRVREHYEAQGALDALRSQVALMGQAPVMQAQAAQAQQSQQGDQAHEIAMERERGAQKSSQPGTGSKAAAQKGSTAAKPPTAARPAAPPQ